MILGATSRLEWRDNCAARVTTIVKFSKAGYNAVVLVEKQKAQKEPSCAESSPDPTRATSGQLVYV